MGIARKNFIIVAAMISFISVTLLGVIVLCYAYIL